MGEDRWREGEIMATTTKDIDPKGGVIKEFPVFVPDIPVSCPKCNATEDDMDSNDYEHNWYIDALGVWHFTCFNCEHEWKAIVMRREK